MKTVVALLFAAAAASAQPVTVGLKAGTPMTDFLSTVRSGNFTYSTTTNRYIVGPTVELRLPFGLGIEFDALYRHFSYQGTGTTLGVVQSITASSGSWEFPLLIKYRFPTPIVRPFVNGGVAWDTLSGLSSSISQTVLSSGLVTKTGSSNPAELHKSNVAGFVAGAGLDIHAIFLHISPEFRYTRWGAQHFGGGAGSSLLNSNRNQGEFLVGITF